MNNELQDEDLDVFNPLVDLETSTIVCPQCKNLVPASLYCVACNSPLKVDDDEASDSKEDEFEQFDVESLREKMGESVIQIEEDLGDLSPVVEHSDTLDFKLTPVGNEDEFSENDDLNIVGYDGANEVGVQLESLDVANNEEVGIEKSIEKLADDIFKSMYLELWSVKILDSNDFDEVKFLKLFRGYRNRLDSCLTQREHFLKQYGELEEFDIIARDSRIELEELEVRKDLGDLREGEYEAISPALRWKISYNESEKVKHTNLLNVLEDLTHVIPQEKILEIKSMAEDAERIIEEKEYSNVLSKLAVGEVKDIIRRINDLLMN
jgi:hypothetical protein